MQSFNKFNKKMCEYLDAWIFRTDKNVVDAYIESIARLVNDGQKKLIIDAGGGRECIFKDIRFRNNKIEIVAIDISKDELALNRDVDKIIVSDISKKIELEDESADIIASKFVLEHLEDSEGFIKECERVLKKGGQMVLLFPCKYSSVSILNIIIPEGLKDILFKMFISKNLKWFPAYYDKCYYSALIKMLKKSDFEVDDLFVSYSTYKYFSFFVPFFILARIYEAFIRLLRLKNLGSFILVTAKKSE